MKQRLVALLGIIGFVVFVFLIMVSDPAFALKDFGDIRTELEDSSNLGCEYITIEDGLFAPINFRAETDSYSPTFSGIVEPLGGEAEYSSENVVGDDESRFKFATESIAEFRIILRDDMQNRTDISRDFFYRWDVSDADNNANIKHSVGSWFSNQKSFCQIIEFRTEEPFTERTEEEILEITEKERRERAEIVDKELNELSAGMVIVSISIVILTIYVLAKALFGLFIKRKPESEASKFKKHLGTELTRLQAMYEYGGKWFAQKDLEFENWKQLFVRLVYDVVRDAVKNPDKTEFKFTPKPNPYLKLISENKGLNLKNFASELKQKIRAKEKDPKAEFIEDIINMDDDKLNELYAEYQKKASNNPDDQDLFFKTTTILHEIKKRNNF